MQAMIAERHHGQRLYSVKLTVRLESQGEATLGFQRVVGHKKNKGLSNGIMQSPRNERLLCLFPLPSSAG